jgi:hypothetical protein
MITFDDTRGEQYTIGAAEMEKYGFVFFCIVSINRPNYLTKNKLQHYRILVMLSQHIPGIITEVTKYTGEDWNTIGKTKGKTGRS